MFNYTFPAVKGVQAGSEYYVTMVPCGLLPKLFQIESDDILPEFRAQRRLSHNRIPEIKEYIFNKYNKKKIVLNRKELRKQKQTKQKKKP